MLYAYYFYGISSYLSDDNSLNSKVQSAAYTLVVRRREFVNYVIYII